MTQDEIVPMVPVMPHDEMTDAIRADGGLDKRYDSDEVGAPVVPDLR